MSLAVSIPSVFLLNANPSSQHIFVPPFLCPTSIPLSSSEEKKRVRQGGEQKGGNINGREKKNEPGQSGSRMASSLVLRGLAPSLL